MDGVDILVEAVRILQRKVVPVSLLLVGDGVTNYVRHIDDLAQSLAPGTFCRIPSIANSDLPAIIDGADIAVAPFRQANTSSSSIPNKVLEYLTGSLPIIVSAPSAVWDALGPCLIPFYGHSGSELADVLATALSDHVGAEECSMACVRQARQILDWSSLMAVEWKMIEAVLTGNVSKLSDLDVDVRQLLDTSTHAAIRSPGDDHDLPPEGGMVAP